MEEKKSLSKNLRVLMTPIYQELDGTKEIPYSPLNDIPDSKWITGESEEIYGMSAVAYFFADKLHNRAEVGRFCSSGYCYSYDITNITYMAGECIGVFLVFLNLFVCKLRYVLFVNGTELKKSDTVFLHSLYLLSKAVARLVSKRAKLDFCHISVPLLIHPSKPRSRRRWAGLRR